MNIQILDSWLRDHLATKASAKEIAKYLSLCGPSVEKLEKVGSDYLYDIEVTTNRVDMMSVRGIAREAQAILPRFGIKAKLKPLQLNKPTAKRKAESLELISDKRLTNRLLGVVLEDIKVWQSPSWVVKRLESANIRPLNAPVDITNYVMLEIGHPSHAFDYDKIPNQKILVRTSKKGEKIIGLDKKSYTLPGDDIVFDDGDGNIIDLPGILGTKNSVVGKNTKRVLFFLDNNDPVRIRKTSMKLGIRSNAAILNEKGVDPELAEIALLRGIQLFKKVCKAKVASKIFDVYDEKPKPKTVKVNLEKIHNYLEVQLTKSEISKYLKALEYKTKWSGKTLEVTPPTFRINDTKIQEDIIEEIARIYGYHNLPSFLMSGHLPEKAFTKEFTFQYSLKQTLKELKGHEVYTLSLVDKRSAGKNALKLKNPLGSDTKYLRTSLFPSLSQAAKHNKSQERFHIFEIANTYLPVKKDLPKEQLMLAGIFKGHNFREAKGVLEELLSKLNISNKFNSDKDHISIIHSNKPIGNMKLVGKFIYYEFEVSSLYKFHSFQPKIKPIPEFPPQVEDITLKIGKQTKIGEVIEEALHSNKQITKFHLVDIYKNNYTFKVHYQDPQKTLTDKEVEKVRNKLINKIFKKHKLEIA